MKKNLLFIVSFFLTENIFAQVAAKQNVANEFAFAKGKTTWLRNKAIFANTMLIKELEQTLFFSAATFDMRFKKNKTNGFGFSAGIGTALNYNAIDYLAYIDINDGKIIEYPKWITLPMSINYLIGKKKHHIEFGIEAFSAIITGDALSFNGQNSPKTTSTIFRTAPFPLIGYRYQALGKGIVIDAIWRPIQDEFTTITPVFSLGIGYGFNSKKKK